MRNRLPFGLALLSLLTACGNNPAATLAVTGAASGTSSSPTAGPTPRPAAGRFACSLRAGGIEIAVPEVDAAPGVIRYELQYLADEAADGTLALSLATDEDVQLIAKKLALKRDQERGPIAWLEWGLARDKLRQDLRLLNDRLMKVSVSARLNEEGLLFDQSRALFTVGNGLRPIDGENPFRRENHFLDLHTATSLEFPSVVTQANGEHVLRPATLSCAGVTAAPLSN